MNLVDRIRGWTEAARVARDVRVSPGDPFEAAMEPWELSPALFDAPRTRHELREIESVRENWRRLREWAAR